jgi:hypothetical protein
LHPGRNSLFASTDSKRRLNFPDILRRPHAFFTIDEIAATYWRRQKLPMAIVE